MSETITSTPTLATADFAVMVVYFVFVVGLGVLFSRREKDTDEYLLGGRRMPWWVIGISYMVSLMSTISLVAVPGEAFKYGVTKSFGSLLAPFAAIGTFYLFVRFYFRVKTFTPFAYLEQRFDRRVRLLGSLVFVWTRLTYLAMVLYSSSKVFEGAAGCPVWLTVCLIGIIGVFYTTLGGMKAVVWTDFMQFIILLIGMAVITIKVSASVDGGVVGIVSYAFSHERGFEGFKHAEFYSFSPYVRLTLWMIVVGILLEFMFYNSSDQISIQRLLATSSYDQAKKSVYTFAIIGLPFAAVLWFIGLAVFAYYGQHQAEADGITGDTALYRFIAVHLPSPLPGLVIAAMLAAVMSTLDSGINSLAAVSTKDIYIEHFRPKATERQQVLFSRVITVVAGVFAIGVALLIAGVAETIKQTIMEVNTIWGAFSAVLAPIFLIGVTTRKVKSRHIIAACVAAWVVAGFAVGWYLLSKQGLDGLKANNASARLLCFLFSEHAPDWEGGTTTAAILGRHLFSRPVSFLFVCFPGLLVMLVMGYLPVLFPSKVDRDKTDGLTLWTLNNKRGSPV